MAAKRNVSAKTRVKLSQAAKRRKRGAKGTSMAGKFAAGAGYAGASTRMAGGGVGKQRTINQNANVKKGRAERQASGSVPGTSGSYVREVATDAQSRAERMVRNNPKRAADQLAYYQTKSITGSDNITRSDMGHAPTRVRSGAIKAVKDMELESNWQKSGTYAGAPRKTLSKFMAEELAASHRSEVDRLLADPNSSFNFGLNMEKTTKGLYNPGQRNRLIAYRDKLIEGYSHDEALAHLRERRQGPQSGRRGSATPRTRETGLAKRDVRTPARKSRYETSVPRNGERNFGVSARGVQKLEDIKNNYPDATDREVVRIQQSQRESLYEEFQKNLTWAHETRRANILGQQGEERTDPERVVFFTTNLGGPSPSVPSDSLIGQYIIRRRKSMLRQEGIASGNQLKGKFPEAVRDMHVMEFSTGGSFQVHGNSGFYQRSGWRRGAKKSRNYGKPTPIGSQIMYDSQGRPMYDDQGNVVFTEGATRPFRVSTRDVGLRVFIG